MKKQVKTVPRTESNELRLLALAVGDFMRYWGFRRIHGQIWTQVYLSAKPLSGADLVKRLKVSKALISPALKQLQYHELIYQVATKDSREKQYFAHEDFLSVIKKVLKSREAKILMQIQEREQLLINKIENLKTESIVDLVRLRKIQTATLQAQFALNFISEVNSLDEVYNKIQADQ